MKKNFPVFIQRYKTILIEKAVDGTIKTHKIFFTFNHNENKTKIIEKEKTKKTRHNQTFKKTCFERMFPE